MIIFSMQKNTATVWLMDGLIKGYQPPPLTDFNESQRKIINWQLLSSVLCEASNTKTLIYLWTVSVAHCCQRWGAASLSVGRYSQKAEISSQSLGTEHLTSRGDTTQAESSTVLAVSQAMFKKRRHFQFNMQRSLNGMLIWATIKWTALPDFYLVCAKFILAVQVSLLIVG